MGKNIKIICTVVPNGVQSDAETGSRYLKLSVFLTPRLPDSGTLNDYYEILHWPDFSDFFQNHHLKAEVTAIEPDGDDYHWPKERYKHFVDLRFDPAPLAELPMEEKGGKAATQLWRRLFKHDTPVAEWVLDEGQHLEKIVHLNRSASLSEVVPDEALQMVRKQQADRPLAVPASLEDAQKDISSNLMYEDEIRAKNRLNQEFHRKISILADHPHLLRATGWILDYRIDIDPNLSFLPACNIIKLSNLEQLPDTLQDDKWKIFADQIDFKTPWTYFEYSTGSGNENGKFSYRYAKKYKNVYFDVVDGFINFKGKNYELAAEQYDRTVELKQLDNQLSVVNDISHNLSANDYTGLKSYLDKQTDPASSEDKVSEGIQIRVKTGGGVVSPKEVKVKNQPGEIVINDDNAVIKVGLNDNTALNIDNYVLFGHHLDTGYIVDVRMSGKQKFRSLCKRTADYVISTSMAPSTSSSKRQTLLKNFSAEAWISEVAIAGKSGKLYSDENICRWNNWSLVCQHHGKHPEDEGVDERYLEYNDLELINIRPQENSLVPLRFGSCYEFRIRVVDICGNSVKEDADQPNSIFISKKYLRFEKVKMPEVFFSDNIYRSKSFFHPNEIPFIRDDFFGEKSDVLVIRSEGGEDSRATTVFSERSICPSRVNFGFAELHGVFDGKWKDPGYQSGVYQKASYQRDEHNQEYFKEHDEIPFITDPVFSGVKYIIAGIEDPVNFAADLENIGHTRTQHFPGNQADYLTKSFSKITITEGLNDFLERDGNPVIVGLKKTAVMRISAQAELGQLFKEKHPNLECVPRSLILIHAVKKPYLDGRKIPSSVQSLSLLPRTPYRLNDENIIVKFDQEQCLDTELFPFGSSSEIWLKMEYEVFSMNRKSVKGYDVQKIIKYEKYINTTIPKDENGNTLPALKFQDPSIKKFLADNDRVRQMSHSFGDTRYYCVKYALEGHSRFMNYFPQGNPEEFVYSQPINELLVLNSKKMQAPEIWSIVPIIEWDKPECGTERSNNTFRVYFGNSWYDSGQEERLAVLFLDDQTGTVDDDVESLVSAYGKDSSNMSERTIGLTRDNFDAMDIVEHINFELLNFDPQSPDELRDRTGQLYLEKLKAAIFEVRYDLSQERFYADIKLKFNPDGSNDKYMPFFKFAVARYQENSIREKNHYDFRFSMVSQAPQVQQLPYRKLMVKSKTNFSLKGPARKTSITADKPNQFYLTALDQRISPGVDLKPTPLPQKRNPVRLTGAMDDLYLDSGLSETCDVYLLEEYEIYDVLDEQGEIMDIIGDNPRDDIRKRMISSFTVTLGR